jgi:hypothetical protein
MAALSKEQRETAQIGTFSGSHTIGVPSAHVFTWDDALWARLNTAIDLNRSDAVSIYEAVENKNLELTEPVEIDSRHGQEPVTHLERPTEGSEQ